MVEIGPRVLGTVLLMMFRIPPAWGALAGVVDEGGAGCGAEVGGCCCDVVVAGTLVGAGEVVWAAEVGTIGEVGVGEDAALQDVKRRIRMSRNEAITDAVLPIRIMSFPSLQQKMVLSLGVSKV